MSSGNEVPSELQWAWTNDDRRSLVGRFHRGLQHLLAAFEAWRQTSDGSSVTVVKELADRIEAAGTDLDVCASNCHALANTLRSHAGIDGAQAASAHAGVRLSKALGSPVILTRTTIEQLAGKTLRLEYIEGANAIVQVNGEYWGTPLDRVLVVQEPPAADAPQAGPRLSQVPVEALPAFAFRLHRLELSNAIQFLTMTARTGILSVIPAASAANGRLTLVMGRVVHAAYGSHTDVEAVARLMNLESSAATFDDDDAARTCERTMNLATDQLLIEAAVKADELAP
jgi:hypothetical protein